MTEGSTAEVVVAEVDDEKVWWARMVAKGSSEGIGPVRTC